jgi:hypothetical protein
MDIFSEKACFKKPVLPENPVKKPAFNLPAGFFNKTRVFSSPDIERPTPESESNINYVSLISHKLLQN